MPDDVFINAKNEDGPPARVAAEVLRKAGLKVFLPEMDLEETGIPGRDTVGVEIPNRYKLTVPLRGIIEDPGFSTSKMKIPLALGRDVHGNVVAGDLAAMPHLLVAGATGSGKSVCIDAIIASMLFRFAPHELRLILIDPKRVEMAEYSPLPHLAAPVLTDPKEVVRALRWVVDEMDRRSRLLATAGVNHIDAFHMRGSEEDKTDVQASASDRLPYIVVIIDEWADLMLAAPAEVEMLVARIARKDRAAGIHLIIATQVPSVDIITVAIKANFPCRIAFQVSSGIESRLILDTKGAEKLLGMGDMLYLPPGTATPLRCQGAFVTDQEVRRLVKHCADQGQQHFESSLEKALGGGGGEEHGDPDPEDEKMLAECVEIIRQEQRASTSLLQRRLHIGYTRAARLMDLLEERGPVGPSDGTNPRDVRIK